MPLKTIVADEKAKRKVIETAIGDLRAARREISNAIVTLAGHYSVEWANEIERLLDQAIRGLCQTDAEMRKRAGNTTR